MQNFPDSRAPLVPLANSRWRIKVEGIVSTEAQQRSTCQRYANRLRSISCRSDRRSISLQAQPRGPWRAKVSHLVNTS